jgi:5-formyltetrahydrofolate cyclo-ligase
MDKKSIRLKMRAMRNVLSQSEQKVAAEKLKKNILSRFFFKRNSRVALYLPNDGEIDTRPLINMLWRRHVACYLPVLHPTRENCLWFFRFTPNTPMRNNRFGITEPDIRKSHKIAAWTLSAALFPLVAFDNNGRRLGMGGGFYDRTFAQTKRSVPTSLFNSVQLIGLAHHFQEVNVLPTEHWDVPLSAIVTDAHCLMIKTGKKPS